MGKGVEILTNILVGPFERILSKIIPDKDAREKMAHELATMGANMSHEVTMAQLEVNKVEAAHKSLFVAGWRPFIGWSCGLSMAFNFLILPMVNVYLSVARIEVTEVLNPGTRIEEAVQVILQIPMIDLSVMMPVLLGMLGLGVMRTTEKIQGVSREK